MLCENILSNTVSPNETEGILIKNIDLEFNGNKDCIEITDMGRDVWECDKCGRLAISFPNIKDTEVVWYKPEDGIPRKLMGFK